MAELTGMFQITTNNKPRDLICFADLSPEEQHDFDYIALEEWYTPRLIRYRGSVYDVNEMQLIPSSAPIEMRRWGCYTNDTFFSGVVCRLVDNGEQVIVGHFYS